MSKDDDAPDWKIDYHAMYGRTITHKPDTPTQLNRNTTQYRVKDMLFHDPNMSIERIMERLELKTNSALMLVMNLRSEYLHTVDFLIRRGATGVRGRDRRRSTRG